MLFLLRLQGVGDARVAVIDYLAEGLLLEPWRQVLLIVVQQVAYAVALL